MVLTLRSFVDASLMAVRLPLPGVFTFVSDKLSRLLNGLIICVMDDMARFSLRGVLLNENARLTLFPNLYIKMCNVSGTTLMIMLKFLHKIAYRNSHLLGGSFAESFIVQITGVDQEAACIWRLQKIFIVSSARWVSNVPAKIVQKLIFVDIFLHDHKGIESYVLVQFLGDQRKNVLIFWKKIKRKISIMSTFTHTTIWDI